MKMIVDYAQGNVPVTILSLQGELDASNYQSVISKAKELYEGGTRHLLLDLSATDFMSSSGVVALHSIILLMRGGSPHDPESGWEAFHAIDRDRGAGKQASIKILNPQPKVRQTLEKTGLDEFFDILTDRQAALEAF